jgi:Leucine-rich repeat (LRR) protein
MHKLIVLDLSAVGFSDEGLELFAKDYLPRAELKSLDLSSNRIVKAGAAQLLGKGFLACVTLRHLILKRMRLNDQALKHISKGFSYKLLSLKLDHNKITDESLKILADQIRMGEGNVETFVENQNGSLWQLKFLGLSKNEITDSGVKYLKAMGLNLPCLEQLEV